jgi:hypothetical protein
MDFITGLPSIVSRGEEYKAILVIIDRFTKYSIFIPTRTTLNIVELAKIFYNEVEFNFGPLEGIILDRGPVFTSEFWSSLCYESHVKRRLSIAFHL